MNKRGFLLQTSLCLMIAASGTAHAGIYKWVDANGNVHFSDSKPEENKVDEINIRATSATSAASTLVKTNTKQVETMKALPHAEGAPVKTIRLDKVVLSLNPDSNSDVAIGKNYSTCEHETKSGGTSLTPQRMYLGPDQTLIAPDEGILKDKGYYRQFAKAFQDNHYPVARSKAELFDVNNESEADLLIGAIVKVLTVNMCRDWSGYQSSYKTSVASYVKVEWQVYDPLNRQIIYETTTEGSDLKVVSADDANGIKQTDARSFGNATLNLLAKPDFIKFLGQEQSESLISQSAPISLNITYGNGTGDFVSKVEQLKAATVTVRTATGHGSGLIVSPDGYLITNAHVVGKSKEVLVLNDNKKYRAEVVKVNAQRDVALLKMDTHDKLSSLAVSKSKIATGESVYVIGTPLDEELSHTVTRGILSAERLMSGKKYYQTDASVNPGNSGGPAFNAHGEVIGVTVAGIFAKDGGSLNINFLIPIGDALTSLGI